MNEKHNTSEIKSKLLETIFSRIPTFTTLQKQSKTGTIIEITPEVQQGKYDITKYIKYGDFNQIISEFYEILNSQFSSVDLSLFYHNLETLTVTPRNYNFLDILSMSIFQTISVGNYNTKTNKLTFLNDDSQNIQNIINHELLHMASTIEGKEISYAGFSQENKLTKNSIGVALNEGYTEYLNRKYFASQLISSYDNEISIAERLEFIIGEAKMKELYFSANLMGIIEELSQYVPQEEAISIIKDFDQTMTLKTNKKAKEEKYHQIRKKLAKIYIEQQRQLLNAQEITEEEFFKRKIMYGNVYIAENIAIPEGTIFHHEKDKIEIIRPDDIIIVDYHPKKETSQNKHL